MIAAGFPRQAAFVASVHQRCNAQMFELGVGTRASGRGRRGG
jgi:hypothetical protein